ncbi:porin family protein [Cereibacter sphaeroides]|uniref:outer membrane protein n=1 Tax=Rhodobacterales TaxID=204455 RepID=UPI000BBEBE9A|nr:MULTISPECIES: outer membrane beta-barrel protein [Paracoccaceae]MCE6953179.1 porin family protein [Cereibacter sphaeroides]MCE6961720.1 porin family protein [Cereibacter sphaeroides]MCE6970496.1 porin family protein [Cereibacter sphaeroides]MCE6975070.1 porin family protein [Cereibacter sphaeroides]
MKRIAALVLGSLLAAPAFAGGPMEVPVEPVIEPAPVVVAPTIDWTGFYAGGQLGYGDIGADGAPVDLDGDGWIGGLHAGYRHDFGSAVIGAEAAYDWASIDFGDEGNGELDDVMRLKLLAGGKIGRGLLYASAGAAWADASALGEDLSDNGYFYGAGYDYLVNDNWIVGAEILQHEFDDFDDSNIDIDATTVQARVSYRF